LKTLLYILYWPLNAFWLTLQGVAFWKVKSYGFLFVSNKGIFKLGEDFLVNSNRFANIIGSGSSSSIMIGKNANLEIGKDVGFSNSTICCREEISIGNHTIIGGNCKIWDTDFHPTSIEQRTIDIDSNAKTSPIHIGQYVFIGADSTIMKGVNIGDFAVVGAGSVVRTNIPENEVWAGNPAVFVKKLLK
jgi:acetyltransferase-like isoleucine patch superfamily enzyme